MKKIILALFMILVATSCTTTYYYSTLASGNDDGKQLENGDFYYLHEEDSLWISYSFNGENAPIRLTVFNERSTPIAINWMQSGLLIDTNAYTFRPSSLDWGDTIVILNKPEIFDADNLFLEEISDQSTPNDSVSYIPSNTMMSYSPINLGFISFEKEPQGVELREVPIKEGNKSYPASNYIFNQENTPAHIKCILSVFTDKETNYMNDFYISSTIKVKSLSPRALPENIRKRGDFFYQTYPQSQAPQTIVFVNEMYW